MTCCADLEPLVNIALELPRERCGQLEDQSVDEVRSTGTKAPRLAVIILCV